MSPYDQHLKDTFNLFLKCFKENNNRQKTLS